MAPGGRLADPFEGEKSKATETAGLKDPFEGRETEAMRQLAAAIERMAPKDARMVTVDITIKRDSELSSQAGGPMEDRRTLVFKREKGGKFKLAKLPKGPVKLSPQYAGTKDTERGRKRKKSHRKIELTDQ